MYQDYSAMLNLITRILILTIYLQLKNQSSKLDNDLAKKLEALDKLQKELEYWKNQNALDNNIPSVSDPAKTKFMSFSTKSMMRSTIGDKTIGSSIHNGYDNYLITVSAEQLQEKKEFLTIKLE